LSAQERRNLLLSTYFGDSLSTKLYKVEWKDLRIRIIHKEVAPSQIMYALNGTIVGLGYDQTDYEYPNPQQRKLAEEQRLPLILQKTPLCHCLGYGNSSRIY
jgi:hypothetical protein